MPLHEDVPMHAPNKDSIRVILEGMIVLLLGWVGITVTTLLTDNAVIKSQLIDIKASFSDIPKIQKAVDANRYDINQHRRELDAVDKKIEDLKVLKNAR